MNISDYLLDNAESYQHLYEMASKMKLSSHILLVEEGEETFVFEDNSQLTFDHGQISIH